MRYLPLFIGSCVVVLCATPVFAASDTFFSAPAKHKLQPYTNPCSHPALQTEEELPASEKEETIVLDALHNKAVDFRNGMQSLFVQLRKRLRSDNKTDRTIVVTDFVNTEQINQINKFGRYLGEEAYNLLPALDFNVVEVKAATQLFILEGKGEIILTRKAKYLKDQYAFASLLIGTYTVTNNYIQVNARIVRMRDQWVLSSASLIAVRPGNDFLESFFPLPKKKKPQLPPPPPPEKETEVGFE